MKITSSELTDQLKSIMEEVLNIRIRKVSDRIEEYQVSSIKFMHLIVAIEKRFGFEFRDEDIDLAKYQRFDDVINVVRSTLGIS